MKITRKGFLAGLSVATAMGLSRLFAECRPFGADSTLPIPIQWQFDGPTLSNRTYIADLDYIKANTDVDVINIAPVTGAAPEGSRLFHDALKELVEHAHKLGIRIIVRASPAQPQLFDTIFTDARATRIIDEPEGAQGLTYDAEAKLDADGCATFTEEARWALQVPKVTPPLRNDIVGAWVFEKTGGPPGDGFYRKGTLVDVTDRVKVLKRTAGEQTVCVEAGREHAGKTAFLVTVQYFNAPDLFGGARFRSHKRLMDELSDIPLDGICMDEQCGMSFAFSPNGGDWRVKDTGSKYDAFRFRYYTAAMARHFRERLGLDLRRLLLDMRYAQEGEGAVRIRAINLFWREGQAQPILIENQVAAYQKKLFGPNVFLACHSTHHNRLDGDDAWKTGNDWWDLPRDYGFTDEYIGMPVRMGVLCATPSKPHFGYNMFYSKDPNKVYWNMALCAPFNLREFHHSYNDGVWGLGYREQPFTANVRRADRAIRPLDELQKDLFPRLDLLVLFGTAAQVNWYPERRDRNIWDVNGGMQVQKKADALWKAGYRCALVPDRTIDDGRLELKDGKYVLNGHAFTHCLFLYPRYATKKAYAFLNAAHAAKMPLAVVGCADLDFDADPATFGGVRVDSFSTDLAARIGCPKSAIPGGCVYEDGSFCLVSEAIATGGKTAFDFTLGGRRFRGEHTGVLLWRDDKVVYATPGGKMECL